MTAHDRFSRDLRAVRAVWKAHHPGQTQPVDYESLVSYALHMDPETRAEVKALLDDPGFQ